MLPFYFLFHVYLTVGKVLSPVSPNLSWRSETQVFTVIFSEKKGEGKSGDDAHEQFVQ